MDRIETLYAEHREIRILAARLKRLAGRHAPPDPVELLHVRRELGRTLTRHLKKEYWLVYPSMKASGRPKVREMAARLYAETGSFEEAFGKYGRRWTSVSISEDWAGYGADTGAIVDRLHRRMALEETELYPLLGDNAGPLLHIAG